MQKITHINNYRTKKNKKNNSYFRVVRLSVPTAQQRTVWGDQKLQKIKYPKKEDAGK